MGSRGQRFRDRSPQRIRDEPPVGRTHIDRFDTRRHDGPSNSRGRELEDMRGREEVPRFRAHEEKRQIRWEAERYSRRSRSPRFSHKERRSRSGGRRSRSAERRSSGMRFEPPDRNVGQTEFERRRSPSNERGRRRRRSSPQQPWQEENRMNKFSPPPRAARFASDEFQKPSEAFVPSTPRPDFLNSTMQPNGPVEMGIPAVKPEFQQIQNFGVPNLSQTFVENPFMQVPVAELMPAAAQNPGANMSLMDPRDFTQPADADDGPLIPEFNPESSKLSSYEWIKLIEDTAKQHDWKKDEKNYVMTSRLAGFARQWYLTTGIGYKGWRELKMAFFKAFPSEMEFFVLLQKMMERSKEEDESMATYFHHKVALLNACDIHGRKAVSCIIAGLRNPKIRYQAKLQNSEDPDVLYQYLRTYPEEVHAIKMQKEVEDPKNKLKTTPKGGKAKSCFYCKSSTHLVAQCPVELKNENKPNFSNSVMHGSLSHKPTYKRCFTDVGIDGFILQGYVDEASECTTIREQNALSLKLNVRKQYKVVRGFGGSSISSMGVVDIALCIDRAIANVRVYVVPDHVQAIPVVVGQSFTEQKHVVVMKDGNKVRFYQRMDNGQTNFDF